MVLISPIEKIEAHLTLPYRDVKEDEGRYALQKREEREEET